MIELKGIYYDGVSSKQTPVTMTIESSGEVLIKGGQVYIKTVVEKLTIAARLGNTRRHIYLENGAKLETEENALVDQLCRYFDINSSHGLLHQLEIKRSYALLALFVIVVFIWAGIEFAVPVVAKWVVKGVPVSVEENIGAEGLETLEKWLFSASQLPRTDQQRLQNQFKQMVAASDKPYHYRLILRNSREMGANALALPGGIIILTDALVKLAENDQQIMAVLAHEMGHIEYQHGLRSVFQDSFTALFMAAVLGDITSMTSLSVALPTMLVESRYSREFELEADRFSVRFMQQQNIKVEEFIEILTLLERPEALNYQFTYISSHPAMDKRIASIKKFAE